MAEKIGWKSHVYHALVLAAGAAVCRTPGAAAGHGIANLFAGDHPQFGAGTLRQWLPVGDQTAVDQPLALLPIAAFTAVLAVASVRLAGLRDAGAGVLADRARAAPRLRLLSGPAGLAIRLARPAVLGWWTAIALS